MTYRGPLLADWLCQYGLHPLRNTLSSSERDLLTEQLLQSPQTRLYAALSGGVSLDIWAQLKTAAATAALAGMELKLPTGTQDEAPRPDRSELDAARTRLRRHSVIAALPE